MPIGWFGSIATPVAIHPGFGSIRRKELASSYIGGAQCSRTRSTYSRPRARARRMMMAFARATLIFIVSDSSIRSQGNTLHEATLGRLGQYPRCRDPALLL